MARFGTLIAAFARDDKGATAIEYGLIAMMIAIGILIALTAFGGSVSGLFNSRGGPRRQRHVQLALCCPALL